MKIGLVDVDGKIPNLALMKISAWHKQKGDSVELFGPLFSDVDKIYASKVFKFTPDYDYFPSNIETVKGGTGYDIKSVLLGEIESIFPDYSLYNSNYAQGFTTRGCVRQCPFCLVPEKEGQIKIVGDIYSFWNGQTEIMLLDNNLTAIASHFEMICKQLIKEKIKVDFNQGLDIRLITPEMAQILSKVRLWKQIHFAFDNIRLEQQLRIGVKTLIDNGVSKHKIMIYVLIGFDSTPEEDLYRVELLDGLGVSPFVMPYNKKEEYQRRFARWVNHKAIFKTVEWKNYRN
jgi:hypothetical protein